MKEAPSSDAPSTYEEACRLLDRAEAERMRLREELDQLKRMIYGARSERFVPSSSPDQLRLDVAPNEEEGADQQEKEREAVSYERPKKKQKAKPVRSALPDHLPREEEHHEPEGLPEGARRIGEEVTELLESTPSKLYVRRIVRGKYAVPGKEDEGVRSAELPSLPLPRANAGAGLLSKLIVEKFEDHLPFHRQMKRFKREGIEMAESTMGEWLKGVCELMGPLYEELKGQVRSAGVLQADETPVPVLTSKKKNASHKGYQWVYNAPREKLVCFIYHKGRGREAPEGFLEDFEGILQTDGYAAYNSTGKRPDVTHLGCMAHIRRKFEEALDNERERAEHVLGLIRGLYDIEREAREQELPEEELGSLREERGRPLLEELIEWTARSHDVLPKSKMGKALAYAREQLPRMRPYLTDPRVPLDNNGVENTVRPVALGRKNYLFAGSHEGAERAAMIYSFLGSCRKNGVEPYQWFKDTLEHLPEHPANRIEELLPGVPASS
jgi:transposase